MSLETMTEAARETVRILRGACGIWATVVSVEWARARIHVPRPNGVPVLYEIAPDERLMDDGPGYIAKSWAREISEAEREAAKDDFTKQAPST